MDTKPRAKKYHQIQRVLWGVLAANLIITIIKIVLGAMTGSLAVIADGFHSMVDSSSNLIGLAAIRLARRPADSQYPYGYQRYETIGALAIGGLLLVAAWEIIQNLFSRIILGAQPEITGLTFGLLALTLPVNIGVAYLETKAGKRLDSEILIADASHTRTDLFVTASVIGSLVGVWLGWPWLDLIVAGGVVILIIKASIQILKEAAGSLADVVGIDPIKIEKAAKTVPGVRYVHNIRSRGTNDAIFVDLHVKVDPAMSTSQAHAVASEVERQVYAMGSKIVDAIVHIEPAYVKQSSDWEKISYGLRQIAEGMGLGLHDLHVHVNQAGEFTIELDLEIQAEVTLAEAHQLADEFENRAKNYWPDAKSVITHLEPATRKLYYPSEEGDDNYSKEVKEFLESRMDSIEPFEVELKIVEEHQRLFLKLPMLGNISLTKSHDRVEEIKRALLREFPEISRIVVHVEPLEEAGNR